MTQDPTQLRQRAPILTVEPDMPGSRRIVLGLAGLAVSALAALDAFAALGAGERGLIPLGLGRLCDFLIEQEVPGAGLLAFLERGHFALLILIGALLLLFGRSAPVECGAGQQLVFRRRASLRRQLPVAAAGVTLLIIGAWTAQSVHPFVAVLLEAPALLMIGWVAWYALIPELRVALSVIVDERQGFANRIVLVGGIFNKVGSIVIRHDELARASILEPSWTRLFQFRDLFLSRRDDQGRGWRIDAIAPSYELNQLVNYLNGDFTYAVGPAGLAWSSRFVGANGAIWA